MSNLRLESMAGNMSDREASLSRMKEQAEQRSEMNPGGEPTLPPVSFTALFEQSLQKVNDFQKEADQAVKEMVAGRSKNIHETMIAVEKADVALKLMMQVRNKVLDAYREIMRMQV